MMPRALISTVLCTCVLMLAGTSDALPSVNRRTLRIGPVRILTGRDITASQHGQRTKRLRGNSPVRNGGVLASRVPPDTIRSDETIQWEQSQVLQVKELCEKNNIPMPVHLLQRSNVPFSEALSEVIKECYVQPPISSETTQWEQDQVRSAMELCAKNNIPPPPDVQHMFLRRNGETFGEVLSDLVETCANNIDPLNVPSETILWEQKQVLEVQELCNKNDMTFPEKLFRREGVPFARALSQAIDKCYTGGTWWEWATTMAGSLISY